MSFNRCQNSLIKNCNPRCKLDGHSAPTWQILAVYLLRCGQGTVYGEIKKSNIAPVPTACSFGGTIFVGW